MYKAERLFQLVVLLRRSRTVTARELATELGVSERTIYRDIQSLILSGVPVEGEAGVGYILRRDFDLPPLRFTNEEAQALLLGARMVQAWGDSALERAARGVLDKVRSVAEKELLDDLDSQLMQVPVFHISPSLREKMGLVRAGVERQRKIQFAYTRADGQSGVRTVRPLGLFFWGNTWSFAGWCELRRAFRNFRVDRMEAVVLTEESFSTEPGKTLEEYICAIEKEIC
jgi:predicted DNA-binding transcriptional regulator YafY